MMYDVVFKSGIVGLLIWVLLFLTSTAALAIAIRCAWSLRKRRILSPELPPQLESHLALGDLNQAYEICRNDGTVMARIANAVFENAHRQNRVVRQETAMTALDKQAREILRQINSLSMCANIAPMLGLLGTVTGMVDAFVGLGTSMGPEKASLLAIAIAQALYTTAAGLLIAVPAIAVTVIFRNTLERRVEVLSEDVEKILQAIPGD